ncbi:RidA family protein [Reinekea sp.]|jgi:enamine deaminase RidA (YjgF/YER057c/UK114 family)|uniref:RidA family protein n=1 Tax=Reinekea sp. TaxID=1970455 RepID=UPI002A812A74|nr:RidA family protein [Reinekea sp.]
MTAIVRKHTNQRMSKIVVHGDTIYLCGQVGERGTSIEEQTAEALRRVEALLSEAGSNKRCLLQTTVWLSDMKYFSAMNGVWDAWVEEGYAPARACGEAKLASSELLVELLVIAAKA